ncbi:MAG: citrate (Si)-synthase [Bacteroidota bacterium]
MDPLKEKFLKKSTSVGKQIRKILAEHGDKKVSDVNLKQVFGGARGVIMMFWETSLLDAKKGIRFRGYSIPQLRAKLPTGNGDEPLPEGLFWLMLTGSIPTEDEVKWLSKEWRRRSEVPKQTFKILDSFPRTAHPMTQFITAIASMSTESVFAKRYAEGMSKKDYWDAAYEDAMNLIAKLPRVAAYIYRRSFHKSDHIEPSQRLDWAANFAHMLGVSKKKDFKTLMRLYTTIHADHEGGNASAHTMHLIGSTLSDPYNSFAGAMGSLAGPLHGLANQEVIKWIMDMLKELGTNDPTSLQIGQYVQDTLAAGKVIPGYGHAVLRQPDPRFMAQKAFAERNIKKSEFVNVVWKIYEVVPPILQSLGKVKNPWPNVDAHSGAILVHYGMTEYSFYTVLFGVSRALGVLAATCWSRALGLPIERPKSVNLEWIKNYLKENA